MAVARRSIVIAILIAMVAVLVTASAGNDPERSGEELRVDLLAANSAGGSGTLVIESLGVDVPITVHSFEVTNTGTFASGGGGGAGKTEFSPLVVRKAIDAASPVLMDAVSSGLHSPSATVTVYRPGTTKALVVYDLQDIIVKGIDQNGSKANAEEVSLIFQKITMTVGSASACFDIVLVAPC